MSAAAVSVHAQTPTRYSQVRHDNPVIDEAVAAMPNSDFTSTINRLSELWNRKQIESLPTGAGQTGQLPENFSRNLEGTLADLSADLLEDELGSLTADQALHVLSVIDVYAFRRTFDLYSPNVINVFCFCPVGQEGCGCPPMDPLSDPAAFSALPGIVSRVRGIYNVARTAAGNPPGTVPGSQLNGNNYVGNVEALFAYIKGVESIDD